MIIVKRDPSAISGSERYEVDCSISWRENLFRIFPDGLDPDRCHVILNCEKINPVEWNDLSKPCVNDTLSIINKPQGFDPLTWALIAIAAAAAAASYLLAPKINLNSQGSSKDSPNNSFTGQTNITRSYQAWPDIFGRIRAYPDIIVPAVTEYVDNVKTLEHTFWLGRGNFDVTEVKYADTPIADYANSTYSIYGAGVAIPSVTEQFSSPEVNGQELLGTNEGGTTGVSASGLAASSSASFVQISATQAELKFKVTQTAAWDAVKAKFDTGFDDCNVNFQTLVSIQGSGTFGQVYDGYGITQSITLISTEYEVVIITKFTPKYPSAETFDYTHAATLDLTSSIIVGPFNLPVECTQIWWNTVFLRGLKGTASFKAQWWAVDSGGVEIPGTRETLTYSYSGTKLDQRYFTKKVTPAYGLAKYKFQIERTNDADTANATTQAKLENLFAMRFRSNVIYSINGVGGTAIRVNSSATEQATSGSEMKFNCMAQRKVITLGAGGVVNYTESASRRACDSIAHHMIIDAGVPAARIDLAGLYAIQQSISPGALGYFDGSFDDADISLGDRVKGMANAARMLVNREGTKWTFARDEAKPYPVVTFDSRTLADSSFTQTISPSQDNGYDSVELEWYDITGENTKSYVRLKWNSTTNLPEIGYGSRTSKIQLTGCSSYEQALDRAELELRKLIYLRNKVEDTALSDADLVWRGDRVRWVDVCDVVTASGEILGVNGSVWTTSEECDFSDTTATYKVCITDADGYSSAWVTATARSDGKLTGFTATGLPAPMIADGDTVQLGSRFLLVKATAISSHDYTLTEKTPNNDGTININLLQYDDRVYLRTLTA